MVEPGILAYLGEGRDECRLDVSAPARALLLGGVPFPEPLLMWWNFVARGRDEVSEARRQWSAGDERFGVVPLAAASHRSRGAALGVRAERTVRSRMRVRRPRPRLWSARSVSVSSATPLVSKP